MKINPIILVGPKIALDITKSLFVKLTSRDKC